MGRIGNNFLGFNDITSTEFYFGNSSSIFVSDFFSEDFICQFDMSLYPFDTQRCSASFVVKGNSRHLVRLSSGDFLFDGAVNIREYVVQETSIASIGVIL